jgi:hypothetical protein
MPQACLAACAVFVALPGLAPAQTPPSEASDFSFQFVMVRIPAAGAGTVGDGTMFSGISFPNGALQGAGYSDSTKKRVKVVFNAADGTPVSAVWQFYRSRQSA